MRTKRHPLTAASPGTHRELHSLHFGHGGAGRKAVIQASLHADEPPGMLVAHHLRGLLANLEVRNRIDGEIVLVPMANPIGLGQRVLGRTLGRFALADGENFNRHYADLSRRAAEILCGEEFANSGVDVTAARRALQRACQELPASSELLSLRRTLLGLAIDADLVLDLHCDNEAVMHLYTATSLWPRVEPLARLLAARASLLADESGDDPFDEACSTVWRRLNGHLREGRADVAPLPDACVAVTVELRGETDVSHDLAASDARALVDYLVLQGFIDLPVPALPQLAVGPTPLAGSLPVVAPVSGVLVFMRAPGDTLHRGEHVADVIDPLSGSVTALTSPADGLMYARESTRTVQAGMTVAKVAGSEAVRAGRLLSA
ncbi:MAG: succinylglutamate desuccinylase/aspartoacylase family protein [Xanthomonadales bacterium]|nr:succinylglutamate desuccinylase/aspartoacylase family protein [Xanthomonadales bacterium]